MQIKCLSGVAEAKVANAVAQGKPKDFDEWIMRVMGSGIADLFMRPYNFKVQCLCTIARHCHPIWQCQVAGSSTHWLAMGCLRQISSSAACARKGPDESTPY